MKKDLVHSLMGRIKRYLTSHAHSHSSYSQCGEDLLIKYVFGLQKIYTPSYLDIGAHNPYYLSNTAIFYNRGSRGINIEANPQLLKDFELWRPRDINLNLGISDQEGELDFYVIDDNTLSTFSKEQCDFVIGLGKQVKEVIKVKVVTVQHVLDHYYGGKFPDILNLDVEGLDFNIIKSIDFERSSPKLICVEATSYFTIEAGVRKNELIAFLISRNYYEYANTNLNTIMVRRDFG